MHHTVAHGAEFGRQAAVVQQLQHRQHGGVVAALGQRHALARVALAHIQAGVRAAQALGQPAQGSLAGNRVDGGKFEG